MKMELIDGSETSAIINQAPGNYPKGNLLYSVHGESLKSRIHWLPYQSSINVFSNTNRQDTSVKIVCCFERVVSLLIICTGCGSCLSRNVSLIIQIWRGLLVLNGGMYQTFDR